MRRRTAAIGIVLTFAIAAPANAQGRGNSSAVVLELPASTRSLAMGDAFAASGGDDAVIFYNPSQLETIGSSMSASISVQRYVGSSTLGAVALSAKLGRRGTLGLGVQVLDYGSAEEILPSDGSGSLTGISTGGVVEGSDYAAVVGYAMRLGRGRAGVATKYVAQRLAGTNGGTAAVDLGTAFDVGRGATIALSMQHLGGDLELAGISAPLPRRARLGGSLPFKLMNSLDVVTVAEVSRTRGSDFASGVGAEVAWVSSAELVLYARAGYRDQPAQADVSPVSYGGGFRAGPLSLDYAYQNFHDLGPTHRIGARWRR
ncbi:MAG: PorV/PorQ family protein [Gemmatimonadaceae bacterium]